MYAHINKTKIFYDVDGQGIEIDGDRLKEKPVVFVIHGGPGGCHITFKPYLDELTKTAQLVYIDQRGCGFSEKDDPDNYTLTQNVEDVEALRQHLGLEKIWILGHSYGGIVAMSYAVKYEKNVAGLILAATSPSYSFLEKAKKHVEQFGNAEQIAMANLLWDGKFESIEQLQEYDKIMGPLYSKVVADSDSHSLATVKRPPLERNVEAANKGFAEFLRTYDVRGELKELNVPALILAGYHDWITARSESEEIHELIDKSELHILKDSSHSLFSDENELTNKLMSEFLVRHSSQ
ncbi:alpha/beta hydrolase [Sporosarcina aquimarina]|uniref:alpha/beta fold hydrolase n=1 Tax=Sporosarcina aquimarina TaxID=114975 RepID=UPI00203E638A|nr:alpha/beta fold hydrolase [Sporosarcina aquimarina]MCM3757255.1 alpha/beta hydrolase [Sporosarcina aquimarina]